MVVKVTKKYWKVAMAKTMYKLLEYREKKWKLDHKRKQNCLSHGDVD